MSNLQSKAEIIANFLDLLDSAQMDYDVNVEAMHKEDMRTQDYLHQLEFVGLKYHEKSKIAANLAETRRERRRYKDAVQVLQPIADFVADPKNVSFINRMKQLLGQVRKVETLHNNRIYMPRVIDIEPITDNQSIEGNVS